MSTKLEIKCLLIRNQEIKENKILIKQICKILEENNNNFNPTLFERIENGNTLKEKIENRVFEKIDSGYNYIIAYAQDSVVGFSEIKVDFVDICSRKTKAATVGTSAVDPDYHGKGVVRALYDEIEWFSQLSRVESITRSTWSKNKKQLSLYEKYGYKEYEREENARGQDNHLIKFKKDLEYT